MHTLLECVTYIPQDERAESWCQPHTVDHYCDLLGIPSNWHSVNGKERNRCRQVAWDRGHFKQHEIKHPETSEVLGYDDMPHHHIVLEGTDEYELSPEQRDKLVRAIGAGECQPRPIWLDCASENFQVAIAALRFPGHEVVKGDHGKHGLLHDHAGCSFISDPLGRLGILYCCYECKRRHDQARCEQVISHLPKAAQMPTPQVLGTKETMVPLARKLKIAHGQVITHEMVEEDVLEDKALYHKRLEAWFITQGIW